MQAAEQALAEQPGACPLEVSLPPASAMHQMDRPPSVPIRPPPAALRPPASPPIHANPVPPVEHPQSARSNRQSEAAAESGPETARSGGTTTRSRRELRGVWGSGIPAIIAPKGGPAVEPDSSEEDNEMELLSSILQLEENGQAGQATARSRGVSPNGADGKLCALFGLSWSEQ